MASSKSSPNTSKTAHVMNLLSKGHDPIPPADAHTSVSGSETPPVQKTEATTPPIIAAFDADATISSQIKVALEDAFSEELGIQQEPQDQPVPESEPAPTEMPSPPETSSLPAPTVQEEAVPEPQTAYINIMQVLVEENADRYMQMLDVCTCSRCAADVKALALNNLQPKYVVMSVGERVPRISVYERQYNTAITAQLLRACELVKEHPHHDR